MFIYNVTVKVDLDIHNDWLNWMRLEHIPEVMATGRFNDHRMLRILEQDESDGITYAVQYYARTIQDYFDYLENEAPALQKQTADRYGEKVVAFRTIMKVV